MQTSQIKIGKQYAIMALVKNGLQPELCRFVVLAIISRKTDDKAAAVNIIEGYIIEQNKLDDNGRRVVMTVAPTKLLGPFEEHKALVEREAKEKQAIKDKQARANANRRELYELLYQLTGLSKPDEISRYSSPFHLGHGNITINDDAVLPLLTVLKAQTKQHA
jgi:hypothetical protein